MKQSPSWEANRFFHLEKLVGSQLVKKFPTFYKTWRFITAFTSARHFSLSSATLIQSIPQHPTSWRTILLLSSHLCLRLPSGLFPSYLLTYSTEQSPSWEANWFFLLEKLIGSQLVKKLPTFYRTWRFITAFTSARHLSLSSATLIQSISQHPTSWRSILILSSHLWVRLPSGLYPSYLPTYSTEQNPSWGKLTGSQLVKKFSAFYGTWRFITAVTSARNLSLSNVSSNGQNIFIVV